MKTKFIIAAGTIVTAAVLMACTTTEEKQMNEAPVAAQEQTKENVATLPQFNIQDASGKVVSLSSFKGKKVFVNLWATWCPPCRAEIPSIQELHRKINKEKVVFVMLSLDNDFATAKEYAANKNMQLPLYYPAEQLPALFRTDGIPVTFIFNEEGKLVKQVSGSDDYDTDSYRSLLQ